MGTKNQRPRRRLKCTIGESLDERDGLRRLFHHTEPSKIRAHDADQLISDLLGMHDDARTGGEQTVEFVEERSTPLVDVIAGEKRQVSTGHTQLVVGVQVVWCATDVDDPLEIVLAQPDDFFLASYLAMACPVATRTLANGELILHDPDEITGLNSEGPLATQFLRHRVTMLPHADDVQFQTLTTAAN